VNAPIVSRVASATRRLHSDSRHLVAGQIARVIRDGSWRRRHGFFQDYCRASLGMTAGTAYEYADCHAAFTREQWRQFGFDKLRLTLRVPKAHRRAFLAKVEALQLTRMQVREMLAVLKKQLGLAALKRTTGRKVTPLGRAA
jgi:hypothetical protein